LKWVFCDPVPWDYDISTPLTKPLGGSQSAMCYLAAALARRGHSVSTITGVPSRRDIAGVACHSIHEIPPELWAAEDSIAVLLNGPAEIGLQFRQKFPGIRRLVLWTGHASDQPAMQHLPDALATWDRIVCVSDWQRNSFHQRLGIPLEKIDILRNAIAPAFENMFGSSSALQAAKESSLRLAYTSTPFRGLDVLVSCFPELRRRHPDCKIDIFSSMKVYGGSADEKEYAALYARCRNTEGVSYRGSVPQPDLAKEMASVSVLAYPNTFPETSCIAVMEAMAAGALVVTSDLAALPETSMGWARLVPLAFARGRNAFENEFTDALDQSLTKLKTDPAAFFAQRFEQARAITTTCRWDQRAADWEQAAVAWLKPGS
jgi:glycosyltransferase involved in cell wall biosynthesis